MTPEQKAEQKAEEANQDLIPKFGECCKMCYHFGNWAPCCICYYMNFWVPMG